MDRNITRERLILTSLPDDCLLEISRYLSVPSLKNLAHCSSRLRCIALEAFRLENKQLLFEGTNGAENLFLFGDLYGKVRVSLQKFPPGVSHETADPDYVTQRILFLQRCCPNLMKLEISYSTIAMLVRLRPPTYNAKYFYFDWSTLNQWTHLKILKLGKSNFPLDELFVGLQCPSLEHLYLIGHIQNEALFTAFALKHTQLKGLTLHLKHYSYTIQHLKISHLVNLEQLQFGYACPYYPPDHATLRKIKDVLGVIIDDLCEISSLRRLHWLPSTTYHESISKLKQLTAFRVKGLKFHEKYDLEMKCLAPIEASYWNDRLYELTMKIPNLVEIFFPDEAVFDKVDFVRQAKNLKRIDFECYNMMTTDVYMQFVDMCVRHNRTLDIVCAIYPQGGLKGLRIYHKFSHIVRIIRCRCRTCYENPLFPDDGRKPKTS